MDRGEREPGPAIIAGGLVWTIGSEHLDGLDPATGGTVEQLDLGPSTYTISPPLRSVTAYCWRRRTTR